MNEAKAKDPVLQRLYELGMVERDCGGGKFHIRCPFEEEHTTGGGPGDTVYFLPYTNGFAEGHFDCKHTHCANRPEDEFSRAIGLGGRVEAETPSTAGDADWPPLAGVEAPQHLTTDLRNAWRLASGYGLELLHVSDIGWHTWRGTHWQRDSEGAIAIAARVSRIIAKEAAELLAKAQSIEDDDARKTKLAIAEALAKFARESESRGKIEAALALAKVYLNIKPTALDSDPLILNCANGTLSLKTGELRPHRHADLLTRCIPAVYDVNAVAPRWTAFLKRIFDWDETLIEFIQRAAGYSLTADTSERCIFLCHGAGVNGKSVLLSTLQALLGEYARTAAPDLLMVKQGDRHPVEIADLRGARLVVAIESGEGRRLHECLIKQMTGGDRMKARFLYSDFFEFDPTHKLWLATNHKPIIRGTDHAIWRRIPLIPFEVTIPQEERDPQLLNKLKTELPGILAWAVQGCFAWQEDGLDPPEKVLAATEAYRQEMDVVTNFIADACVLHPQAEIKASCLYAAYKAWCEQNGERYESQQKFGRRLAERGLKKRQSDGSVWEGIRASEEFKARGFN